MSILSDGCIKLWLQTGQLKIEPGPDEQQIQPASLDIRLGNDFVRFREVRGALDVRDKETFQNVTFSEAVGDDKPVTIKPGEFILAVTKEKFYMPDNLVARVEGRSSVGRMGLAVHVTAGFIDPGFEGFITFELANLNRFPITVYPGMRIAQIAFETTSTPAEKPYGHEERNSKYQGQGPVPTTSKIVDDL